jgi:hypothetical protein
MDKDSMVAEAKEAFSTQWNGPYDDEITEESARTTGTTHELKVIRRQSTPTPLNGVAEAAEETASEELDRDSVARDPPQWAQLPTHLSFKSSAFVVSATDQTDTAKPSSKPPPAIITKSESNKSKPVPLSDITNSTAQQQQNNTSSKSHPPRSPLSPSSNQPPISAKSPPLSPASTPTTTPGLTSAKPYQHLIERRQSQYSPNSSSVPPQLSSSYASSKALNFSRHASTASANASILSTSAKSTTSQMSAMLTHNPQYSHLLAETMSIVSNAGSSKQLNRRSSVSSFYTTASEFSSHVGEIGDGGEEEDEDDFEGTFSALEYRKSKGGGESAGNQGDDGDGIDVDDDEGDTTTISSGVSSLHEDAAYAADDSSEYELETGEEDGSLASYFAGRGAGHGRNSIGFEDDHDDDDDEEEEEEDMLAILPLEDTRVWEDPNVEALAVAGGIWSGSELLSDPLRAGNMNNTGNKISSMTSTSVAALEPNGDGKGISGNLSDDEDSIQNGYQPTQTLRQRQVSIETLRGVLRSLDLQDQQLKKQQKKQRSRLYMYDTVSYNSSSEGQELERDETPRGIGSNIDVSSASSSGSGGTIKTGPSSGTVLKGPTRIGASNLSSSSKNSNAKSAKNLSSHNGGANTTQTSTRHPHQHNNSSQMTTPTRQHKRQQPLGTVIVPQNSDPLFATAHTSSFGLEAPHSPTSSELSTTPTTTTTMSSPPDTPPGLRPYNNASYQNRQFIKYQQQQQQQQKNYPYQTNTTAPATTKSGPSSSSSSQFSTNLKPTTTTTTATTTTTKTPKQNTKPSFTSLPSSSISPEPPSTTSNSSSSLLSYPEPSSSSSSLPHFEASAKTGTQVETAFETVARLIKMSKFDVFDFEEDAMRVGRNFVVVIEEDHWGALRASGRYCAC